MSPTTSSIHVRTSTAPSSPPSRYAARLGRACALWDLSLDFYTGTNAANPNPDRCGNQDVWFFMQSATLVHDASTYTTKGMDSFVNTGATQGLDGWHGSSGDANGRLPVIFRNATTHPIHLLGFTVPAGVMTVHPATTQLVVVGWKSPIDGTVALSADSGVKDLDPTCGNGISWDIQHNATSLAHGAFPNGGAQLFAAGEGAGSLAHIEVHRGDFLYAVVDPNGNYACDSTELDLRIQQSGAGIPAAIVQEDASASSVLPPSQDALQPRSAGDPVNTIFGNFTYGHTDLAIRPGVLPVSLVRSYNSALPAEGMLGWGWHLSYDLHVTRPTAFTVAVTRGDGRVDPYSAMPDGSLTPPPGSNDLLARTATGYTLTTRTHLIYRFDTAGQLRTLSDRAGNTSTLLYSGGRWTGLRDAAGRLWQFAYHGRYLSAVSDPAGRTVRYGHDATGNLIAVVNAAGGITHYRYDGRHRLTAIIDANGHVFAANSYDKQGRVIVQRDGRGVHHFTYHTGDTVYTGPTGATSRIFYNALYQPTRLVDALGRSTVLTYSGSLVTAVADTAGGAATYSYDPGGATLAVLDTMGHGPTLTYDGRENLLTATDALGHVSRYTYDIADRLTSATDAAGALTRYSYDARGRLTTVTDALGGVTRDGYDVRGWLTTVTNALGGITRYTYDGAGNRTGVTDALGHTTRRTFNALGEVTSVTAPDGGVTRYAYDAAGNRTTATDPLGRISRVAYNAANDPVALTDPMGSVTRIVYDALGRPLGLTLPDGATTRLRYDARGRPVSRTAPLGDARVQAYTSAGDLLHVRDPLGRALTYSYDTAHHLVGVVDAAGGVTRYSYDTAGELTAATDALGHTTHYVYDALGRRISATDAAGTTHGATYDALGRISATSAGTAQRIAYRYDALGRLLNIQAGTNSTLYTYDADGNRMSMTDPVGRTTYRYDAANRLTAVLSPRGTVYYAYDMAGERTAMSQPGLKVSYHYNLQGRLAAVAANGRPVVSYTYDSAGRNTAQRFGNGVATLLRYDRDGRLTGLVTTSAKGILQRIAYTLNAEGDRTMATVDGVATVYRYDVLDRLVGASTTGGGASDAYTYRYDALGNRLSATVAGHTVAYTYDAANHLTSAGDKSVTYDVAGNLTSDGLTTYGYDAQGRVTSVSGAAPASYIYDGDGHRVEETLRGKQTHLLYDVAAPLPHVIAATGAGGTEQDVYGLLRTAHLGPGGALHYETADALGSVRLLTDARGHAISRAAYDPFGIPLAKGDRFGFGGAPQGTDGLVSFPLRDYSPVLGRFLQPDPHSPATMQPLTLNPYSYVLDNPVNGSDATGAWCVFWVIGNSCGQDQQPTEPVSNPYPAPSPPPPSAPQPPASSTLVGNDGSGLVASGAGNLVGNDGSGLVASGAGNLVASGAGNLVASGAGNLVASGAGNLVASGAGNLVGNDGSGLVGNDGSGLILRNSAYIGSDNVSPAPPLAESSATKGAGGAGGGYGQ